MHRGRQVVLPGDGVRLVGEHQVGLALGRRHGWEWRLTGASECPVDARETGGGSAGLHVERRLVRVEDAGQSPRRVGIDVDDAVLVVIEIA